jgi:nuclear pore complex protein Nup160
LPLVTHSATGINNLTFEDSEALNLVLPAQQFDTRHSFYLFAANLFRNTSVHHEVYFSNLAIQTAPPTADAALLWNTIVNGLIDLALYEDAYASIMATPFDKQ